MSDRDDPQDEALSALYKAAATEQPSAGLDARILAAARATASAPRAKTGSGVNRWRLPFALAATVLLTSTLTLMVREHAADPSSVTDRAGRSERAEPASPPAPSAPPAAPEPPQAAKTTDQPATLKDEASAPAPSRPVGQISSERKAMQAAPPASRADSAESTARAAGAAAEAVREMERSPLQWLAEIRRLRDEGRADEAAAQLAAFRKRHPEYLLPEDLRQP